jgi:hypothetical protein
MTSGAAGEAQYIGYDRNDLAYDLLNEPVSSLDGRGLDSIANRNIFPPKNNRHSVSYSYQFSPNTDI